MISPDGLVVWREDPFDAADGPDELLQRLTGQGGASPSKKRKKHLRAHGAHESAHHSGEHRNARA